MNTVLCFYKHTYRNEYNTINFYFQEWKHIFPLVIRIQHKQYASTGKQSTADESSWAIVWPRVYYGK